MSHREPKGSGESKIASEAQGDYSGGFSHPSGVGDKDVFVNGEKEA